VDLDREGVAVLRGLDLDLREDRIGVVGVNGSGKSSLLRVLNGLLPATRGTVRVAGADPAEGPARMASLAGMIFQNPDHQILFPTVLEEITFGLRNLGRTRAQAQERAREILREHRRESWADRPVHTLSEGQRHWLCILAVLAMEPRVLLLDEPFASLDPRARWALLARLGELSQQVVLVSHDLDTLGAVERVLWLDGGRLREDGPPERVLPAFRDFCREGAEESPC